MKKSKYVKGILKMTESKKYQKLLEFVTWISISCHDELPIIASQYKILLDKFPNSFSKDAYILLKEIGEIK